MWLIDSNLPIARERTMEQVYRESMARSSFTLVMLVSQAMAAAGRIMR